MARFFTSDLHDNHQAVAELRGFDSVADHRQALELNWRDVITDTDEVFVLGDISMKNTWAGLCETLDWMQTLPGHKRLILGNHDAGHPMHRRSRRFFRGYLGVFRSITLHDQLQIGEHDVLLSHFPYQADHSEHARHLQWRLPDFNRMLLHGHLHSKDQATSDHEIHVGLDAWELTPVHEHEVLALLDELAEERAKAILQAPYG